MRVSIVRADLRENCLQLNANVHVNSLLRERTVGVRGTIFLKLGLVFEIAYDFQAVLDEDILEFTLLCGADCLAVHCDLSSAGCGQVCRPYHC